MLGFARLDSVLFVSRRRLLPAYAAAVAVAAIACWSASDARAAAKAPYTVAVTPTSVVAGSTGQSFTFAFTAIATNQTRVAVRVPVGPGATWTAPQATNPAGAGYVSAAKGTCHAAAVAGVSGPPGQPQNILVDTKCAKGKSFALTYGAGTGAKVTAAATAGPYTFATRVAAGGSSLAVATQPVVTVRPGPTSRLAVGGLANAVGQAQDLTVTAQDAFGNTTPAYRGTVHVEGDGPPAAWVLDVPLYPGWNRFEGFTLPGDYAFTASDAGVHTFAGGATIIFAGAQTVTATDTTTATITGSQAVTMSPGPMAGFDVLAPVLSTSHRVHIADAQVPKQRLTVAAFDQYGNVATSFNGTLAMSYSFSTIGSTPGDLPATLTLVDGTASSDVTWPTQTDGDITVNMRGKYGTGPLPPPKTFTREVAIASDRPALNAVVITLPPANPGDAPTYQLTIPDQNLVVDGSLTVTTIYPPATVGASIPIDLSGTTITGDSIIVHTTISDPVVNGSGLIVDASTQAGATGTNLVNTATGQTVLQTGTELTVTGDPDAPTFGAVAIIYPGSLFLSTGTNQESQTMVAFSVAPPTCPAGSTWSPNLGKCV